MEPPIQRPRRTTLRFLRKAALAASALYLSGFGLAAVMAILPFDLRYRFEIAYAGLGALVLGVVWQEVVLVTLRRLVPIDTAMQSKIRKYRWSAGPVGDLMSILMLTKESEAAVPTSSEDPPGDNPEDRP